MSPITPDPRPSRLGSLASSIQFCMISTNLSGKVELVGRVIIVNEHDERMIIAHDLEAPLCLIEIDPPMVTPSCNPQGQFVR